MIVNVLLHLLTTSTFVVSAKLQCVEEKFAACILAEDQKEDSLRYTSLLQVDINRMSSIAGNNGKDHQAVQSTDFDQETAGNANVSKEGSMLEILQESTTDLSLSKSMRLSDDSRRACACQGPIPPKGNCTCAIDLIKATVKQHIDVVKEIIHETRDDIEDVIAEEAVRRLLHLDCLCVLMSCIVYFVLPWLWGPLALAPPSKEACNSLPVFFPALHSLRYCTMLALLLRQSWLRTLFSTSEFYLILSGFVLEFAEQTRLSGKESIVDVYKRIVPRRFARLYPLYALSIIITFLRQENPSTCNPITSLLLNEAWGCGAAVQEQDHSGAWHLKPFACGEGTWFVSIVFGCYLLFPVVSAPMRYLQLDVLLKLWACCVLLVIIPRAFGSSAHAHNLWWTDVFHPQQLDVGIFALRFSQRSLLHGLAYFFSGIILARAWFVVYLQPTQVAEQFKSTSFRSQLIQGLSRRGCMIAFAILTSLWYFTSVCYPERNPPRYVLRLVGEVWRMVGLSCLILGAAGEYGSSPSLRVDPIFWALSIPSFAWMGELALPMYLSSSWLGDFALQLVGKSGVPLAPGFAQATLHLLAANVGALILYMSCGSLASNSKAGKGVIGDD